MAWEDLKFFLPPELYAGDTAVCRALHALGYTRRLRRRRIRHTAANQRTRVRWCQEMLRRFPHPQDWESIIFSDETWAVNDPMWKKWVTTHNMEDPNDFALLRRHPQGWMFWGCFAGGKNGPGYFWEKGCGGINQYNYTREILPMVKPGAQARAHGSGGLQPPTSRLTSNLHTWQQEGQKSHLGTVQRNKRRDDCLF
ncbi:hypothetical protein F5883DRAFT_571192 [Diaporthe sp. PMI_573]|nr:hypothetical protein F5883DRAFT_571192 [Diaporthaceae sp. PMI_573]